MFPLGILYLRMSCLRCKAIMSMNHISKKDHWSRLIFFNSFDIEGDRRLLNIRFNKNENIAILN